MREITSKHYADLVDKEVLLKKYIENNTITVQILVTEIGEGEPKSRTINTTVYNTSKEHSASVAKVCAEISEFTGGTFFLRESLNDEAVARRKLEACILKFQNSSMLVRLLAAIRGSL